MMENTKTYKRRLADLSGSITEHGATSVLLPYELFWYNHHKAAAGDQQYYVPKERSIAVPPGADVSAYLESHMQRWLADLYNRVSGPYNPEDYLVYCTIRRPRPDDGTNIWRVSVMIWHKRCANELVFETLQTTSRRYLDADNHAMAATPAATEGG